MLLQQGEFSVESLGHFERQTAVATHGRLLADLPQIARFGVARWQKIVGREVVNRIGSDIELAPVGNLHRVGYSLGMLTEECVHFSG